MTLRPSLLLCTLLLTACGAETPPDATSDAGTLQIPIPTLPVVGGGAADGGAADGGAADGGGADGGVPAPSRLTVSGTVLSAARQPLAGLRVRVTGHAPVSTDAAGRFSVSGVTPPYELTVVDAPHREAVVYRGLRREDPTLLLFVPEAGARQARVQGRISGAYFPQDGERFTALAFLAPGAAAQALTDASGAFSLGLQWYGPSALSGTLHALQLRWVPETGLPRSFSGYARQSLTLEDGAEAGGEQLVLLPVANSLVSGTVSAPAGYSLQGKGVGLTLDGAVAFYFPEAATGPDFEYVVPDLAGAQVLLTARVSRPGGGTSECVRTGIAAGTAGVTLAPAAPPELLQPAEGAVGVDAQRRFSWTPFAQGIHRVVFEPVGEQGPRISVLTGETSTALPDLGALGLALPRSAGYVWRVEGVGPLAGPDAAASPTLLDTLTLAPGVRELQSTRSAERSFVTAP